LEGAFVDLFDVHDALSSVLAFLRPERTCGGRKSLLPLTTGLTKSLPAAAARIEGGGGTDLDEEGGTGLLTGAGGGAEVRAAALKNSSGEGGGWVNYN